MRAGSYNGLMQLRIPMTGLLHQLLFGTRLSANQWRAIGLITLGCVVRELAKLQAGGAAVAASSGAWALLLTQMSASVFAGVYNELLLKGGAPGPSVPTNLQNAYMYADSIACNILLLLWQGKFGEAVASSNVAVILAPHLLLVVGIMSTVGLVTGFFLRHLDTVRKAIASALEVLLTTMLSWALFGTPLDGYCLAAVSLVGYGIALYARTPAESATGGYTPVPRSSESEVRERTNSEDEA